LLIKRAVYPEPAPFVWSATLLAATNRSVSPTVVNAPLLLVVVVPVKAVVPSSGLTVSSPLYSRIRTSGKAVVALNATVTTFPLAAAVLIFFAK
jgi:hypothetical protein